MTEPYWTAGGLTIYHGECHEILLELAGADIALTVTSPPYNIGGIDVGAGGTLKPHARTWAARANKDWYPDTIPEGEYREQQTAMAAAVAAASAADAVLVYNHKPRYKNRAVLHPIDLIRTFKDWHLQQEIIWDRAGMTPMPGSGRFTQSDERLYWMTRGRPPWHHRAVGWGTVWRFPAERQPNGHPCPFPAEIPWRAMMAATNRHDLVLDPYMGSGTVLRVAQQLGRRCIGIERDERWCEMAAGSL